MKRIAIVTGILILGAALTVPALARGPYGGGRGWSGGPGSCWQDTPSAQNLTEDQRNELNKLDEAFFEQTAELRREIWVKSDELNLLMRKSDPDAQKAQALQREISERRAKMAEQRLDHELKARKIAPERRFARGHGRGSGWHMKGYGSPRGGGFGPGSCWN
jgi:zinc resistance-associated protein